MIFDMSYLLTGKGSKKVYDNSVMERPIRKALTAVMKGEFTKFEDYTKGMDFEKEQEKFGTGMLPSPMQALLFSQPEDQQDVLASEAANRFGYVSSEKPVNQSVTIFGVEDLPPSNSEQTKWLSIVDLLYNPEHMFDKFTQNALSFYDIDVFKAVYPELWRDVQTEAIDQITKTKKEDLTLDQIRIISMILGVIRITPQLIQEKQEEENAPKSSSRKSKLAEQTQTNTQRITAK